MNMVMLARPDARIRSIEAALLGNVLAGDAVVAEGQWGDDGDVDRCDAHVVCQLNLCQGHSKRQCVRLDEIRAAQSAVKIHE